jgi:hypothetical protein
MADTYVRKYDMKKELNASQESKFLGAVTKPTQYSYDCDRIARKHRNREASEDFFASSDHSLRRAMSDTLRRLSAAFRLSQDLQIHRFLNENRRLVSVAKNVG